MSSLSGITWTWYVAVIEQQGVALCGDLGGTNEEGVMD